MKILIVSQYFWPENFRINDLALGLVQKGHEVTVLTGVPNYPQGKFFKGYGYFSKEEYYKGICIIRVPLLPRGKSRSWELALNYFSFIVSAGSLGLWRCRGEYDVVFVAQYSPVTVGIPALLIKKIKKIPMFFWVQDLWPESLAATGSVKSPLIIAAVEKLVRFLYRDADRILVQSAGFGGQVRRIAGEGYGTDLLPNWAEELYKPIARDIEMSKKLPQGFRVMFAGNIGVAQDFPTIIDAAERLKGRRDIQWLILGDGRERTWVSEEIVQRGLSATVHLLGSYPVERMPDYFAQADVMLVTLKREPIFAITIPGKIQSYLACGKPVIAALDGAGADVIRDSGAGLVVEPQSPNQLADAVVTMAGYSGTEREALGRNALRYYEDNFSREILLNRLEQWMQQTLKEKGD